MSKRSFHDQRNTKKMLEYGVRQGMGAFRPRPPKPTKQTSEKEQKPKTEKE